MKRSIVVWIAAVYLLAACGGSEPAPPSSGDTLGPINTDAKLLDTGSEMPKAGELAPDFSFVTPEGTTSKLSDFKGKKVILNFWATWCFPCRSEMPALQKAANEHSDVIVLGVNRGQPPEIIAPFGYEVNVSFPLVSDTSSKVAIRYGANNLPMTYFINTDGTVANLRDNGASIAFKLGEMDYEYITEQIGRLK